LTEATPTDAAADIVAETINLAVTGPTSTIGTSTSRLEIDAVTLNASSAGGSQFLEDTAGGLAVGLVTATQVAGNEVNLIVTNGSLTEATPTDAAADIVAETINLAVTGPTSTIGTSTSRLEIDAVTLNASSAGGSQFLEDTAGGLAIGLVTTTQAVGSQVDLLVSNGNLNDHQNDDLTTQDADIISETLTLKVTGAGSTIGGGGRVLEFDAVTLKNVTTDGGDIFLTDTKGGVAIDLLTTGGAIGSKIVLSSLGGGIMETSPRDAQSDLVADSVQLTVVGPQSDIGSVSEKLEIDANTVGVTTIGGARNFLSFPDGTPTKTFAPGQPSALILQDNKVLGGGDINRYQEAQFSVTMYDNQKLFYELVGLSYFGQAGLSAIDLIAPVAKRAGSLPEMMSR
jgi:hypothetical protein